MKYVFFLALVLRVGIVSSEFEVSVSPSGEASPHVDDDDGAALVQEQYERFPYPFRDADEQDASLPVSVSPHIVEINHFLWGGKRDFCDPFRALIAGGGTGEKTIQLLRQLTDMNAQNFSIVHFDISRTSISIAKRRVEALGLSGLVEFVHGSLTDILSHFRPSTFDFIDCLGVLHHLPQPATGLSHLAQLLRPGGGMAVMLYGELGRRGIYEMQQVLRTFTHAKTASWQERIHMTRVLLTQLPDTNWLKIVDSRWEDLNQFLNLAGDSGLVDIFLPAIDRAYRVPDILELINEANQQLIQLQDTRIELLSFVPSVVYDPHRVITDSTLSRTVDLLTWEQKATVAELLNGNIYHHYFYLLSPGEAFTAHLNVTDLNQYPIPVHFNQTELAQKLTASRNFLWRYRGGTFKFRFPLGSSDVVKFIDGQTSLAQIFERLRGQLPSPRCGADQPTFISCWKEIFSILNSIQRLFLSIKPIDSSIQDRMRLQSQYMHDSVPANFYQTFEACAT